MLDPAVDALSVEYVLLVTPKLNYFVLLLKFYGANDAFILKSVNEWVEVE